MAQTKSKSTMFSRAAAAAIRTKMKSLLKSAALGGALFIGPFAFSNLAAGAPQIDQSNLSAEQGGTAFRVYFVAQVITVGQTGVLTSIDLAVRKFADDPTSSGDITLEIRSVDATGKPTETVLGSLVFARASISTLPAEFTTFDVSSLNLSFTAGDTFAVAVASKNISGSSFPIALTDDSYTGGDFWGSFVCGSSVCWSRFAAPDGWRDTRFRTFVANPIQTVGIDIKPGSDPNCFNVNGHGVIPVAILGSADFNVNAIDPLSLKFGAFAVRVRGNKGPLCSIDDFNGDHIDDMVCQFEDDGTDMWEPNPDATATLTGVADNGTVEFRGTDRICVVPN